MSTPPDTTRHAYIGDGVYAEYTITGDIALRLGDHKSTPVVILEPEVFRCLARFEEHRRNSPAPF